MRFLLDECISARLVDLLAVAGHDTIRVETLGLLGHTDEQVLAAARTHERVLISADTDFGELLAVGRDALPSVILLRQGNRSPDHPAATIIANLDDVADDLDQGALVVLTDDRIRIRSLPLR